MDPDGVKLDWTDRTVAYLLATGHDAKEVAAKIDVALSTVYRMANSMCARAQVVGIPTLIIWILQHPACLFANVVSCPGLHVQPCECGSPYCLGMIAAQLPPRADLTLSEEERSGLLAGLAEVRIDTEGFSKGLSDLSRRFLKAS